MASNPWVVEIHETQFEKEVLERSRSVPVILDFWADWCGPCKMLGPELEKLAEQFLGRFVLAKVDIDRNPNLAAEFGVSSIPTVVAIVDGQIAGQFSGLLPKSQIAEFLERICPTEAQRLARQAEAIENANPTAAEELYRKALTLEPKLTTALAGLAELCAQSGHWNEARELVSKVGEGSDGWQRAAGVRDRLALHESAGASGGIDQCEARIRAHPNDLEARRDLGLAYAAAGRYEEALETLVQIVEADRDFGASHIRAEMVKILGIVGPQNELAGRYRPRLASALY